MALVLILLLGIFVLIASKYHPVFTFWLLINLYFDPGGYQTAWFQNNIISVINFDDVIFLLCWIPYFNIKNKLSTTNEDKFFFLFYKYMSIFMLYFVLVYGIIIPQISGRADFTTFLIKSRSYFMAFLLVRPIYFFVKHSLSVQFNIIIYLASICLTLYFISLITGLKLIPIATGDRYVNSGIIRITLWSYGLFDWVLNLAFIVLLLKIKVKNQRLLFYSALLMAFSIALTLTRRELLGRIFILLIIFILLNYLLRSQRRIQIIKLILPIAIILALLSITFPKYLGYVNDEYKSIESLTETGKDLAGNVDYRFAGTGDVVLMKELIRDNLFFGVGFTRFSLEDLSNLRDSNNPLAGLYAGGELPYLGSIGKMGIFGLLMFLPVYLLILQMSLRLFRIIKNSDINIFIKNNYYELIFAVFALAYTINKFTFNLYSIFSETTNASAFLVFTIILSILIVSYNNLNKTLQLQKAGVQNFHSPETITEP
jgi:hypothetical protein